MNYNKAVFKKKMSLVAVLWIILSSNSLVYCIFNMKLCMAVLGVIAGVFLLMNIYVNRKNVEVFIVITIILTLNLSLNIEYTTLNESIAILLIRCASLMIIMSNIDRDDFVDNYIVIMAVLSVLSIACFILTSNNINLPFQTSTTFKNKYYIYTFYHTIGRWGISERNCGIFWEPGGYQIFLNYALLMLLVDSERIIKKIKIKKYILIMAIFVITIMTTLSTTGFICLALVLAIGVLHQNGNTKIKGAMLILILISLIAFFIVESNLGIIESKAINQEGSFTTRYNDTIVSLKLGLQRAFGYGYGNTYSPTVLSMNGVTDNSSGLGALLISFGACATVGYLFFIWHNIKKMFKMSIIESVIAIIIYIIFIMSENVYPITLFLTFLFFWSNDQRSKERFRKA